MIEIVNLNKKEHWDEIVRSFKEFDVYYLSGYVLGFKVHGDGEPLLFYYNDSEIKAMIVMMKRDIANDIRFSSYLQAGECFDVTSPYGYGGFILEGDLSEQNIQKLYTKYIECLKDKNIVSSFVRYHPLLENSIYLKGVSTLIDLGKTIAIDLKDEETIWGNFTSKNRNTTRRAIKNGVIIKFGRGKELLDEFITIYNQTMDNDNAIEYYYFDKAFYNSLEEELKDNYMFFYAEYQGKIISMSIILFANRHMHYHLSGSIFEYRNLAPTNLLLYEAARWGSEQGYKYFHLGGGLGASEDNLYKFKAAFNRDSNFHFVIGKDIINEEKYLELVNYRKSRDLKFDVDNAFFPLYRS